MSKFCMSNNGETYEGEFDSRGDAVAEGRELYPNQTIWTARIAAPSAVEINRGDVARLIEGKQDRAYDEVGEVCDGWLNTNAAQDEDLRARIDAVFQAWLTEHNLHPTWRDIADDMEHAAKRRIKRLGNVKTESGHMLPTTAAPCALLVLGGWVLVEIWRVL